MSPRKLFTLSATIALAVSAFASPSFVPRQEPRASAADLLERATGWPEVAGRVDELIALGPAAIPELLAALAGSAEGEDAAARPRRTAAQLALRGLPVEDLRAFLETLAAGRPDPSEREQALTLLGQVGSSRDLDLLARLAAPSEPMALVPPSTRAAFGSALDLLLRREPTTMGRLPRAYDRAHPSLLEAIVASTGRTAAPEAPDVLVELLGVVPAGDALLLRGLAAQGNLGRRADELRSPLLFRGYLNHEDPTLLVLAITAAVELGDQTAVPVLVQRLEHADANVRRAAERALAKLTRLPFGSDREAWIRWHREEAAWWKRDAPASFDALCGPNPDLAVRAVLDIASKRLDPDRLATQLAAGLLRKEPQLVRMTCHGLMQLPSRAAAKDLVEALEHSDPLVRADVLAALRTITGLDLSPDVERWRTATGG